MKGSLTRRGLGATAVAVGVTPLFSPGVARAALPDGPLRMILGFSAGGTVDNVARIFAEGMGRILGQPVVVENRPGASNTLAAEGVIRAPADGATMLGAVFSHAVAPAFVRISYDTLADFTGVTQLVNTPVFLFASRDTTFDTVPAMVEAARAAPGTITYASGGVGSSAHLAIALLQRRAGIELTHVPFRGGGDAFQALMGGHVGLLCSTPQAGLQALLDERRLKALAVMLPTRLATFPNVPTIVEAGLGDGLEVQAWQGVLVRSGVPRAATDRLFAAIREVGANSEVQQRLANWGVLPAITGPDAFTEFFRSEVRRWTQVARDVGLSAH